MTKNGSVSSFQSFQMVSLRSAMLVSCSLLLTAQGLALPGLAADTKTDKPKAATPAAKTDAKTEKKAEAKQPEPPIENVQEVSTDQLVDKPHEYLNKNVKFDANFANYCTLALDYKPAMRSSKNYLSFLVMRPKSKIPYSELKIAMAIPKDKDPQNQVLSNLKEGDELEITAHVFATSLDEPWVDVLRLKKLASAPEKKLDDKKGDEPESETHK